MWAKKRGGGNSIESDLAPKPVWLSGYANILYNYIKQNSKIPLNTKIKRNEPVYPVGDKITQR